jgi:hypothetical protein
MRNTKYQGLSKHKLYITWRDIKTRCYNKNSKDYIHYGSRNITMCDEWLNNFMSFFNWCEENGYKDGLEIDRIDNNGNYYPENCHFITHLENCGVGKLRKYSCNKSGYVGVSFNKQKNKFSSYITIKYKRIHLGTYNTKEEALQSRIDYEVLYFGKQMTNLL